MNDQPESYGFKAEIQQLLYILAHSLYKDRDIFLRELVSNASDALTRLQFEALTNNNILDAEAELAIHVEVPENGEGEPAVGAPRLSDQIWLFGGDRNSVIATIANSRAGVMPAWAHRLSDAQIKQVALYVHGLGGGQ